ncbi:MAG: hypothetical protein ACI8XU_001242 [Kiritimatiellia bacterium]|jgi:hypothetical protein
MAIILLAHNLFIRNPQSAIRNPQSSMPLAFFIFISHTGSVSFIQDSKILIRHL